MRCISTYDVEVKKVYLAKLQNSHIDHRMEYFYEEDPFANVVIEVNNFTFKQLQAVNGICKKEKLLCKI